MSTVVLNAASKAYPAIANRIRAAIYLQTDPQAFIAQIIDITAGHPARIWSFPGLPRNNYGFTLDEIDGAGLVLNNLALFDVVPGTIDGALVRDDEQITVNTTTGLVAGSSGFVFDGTGGKPNYIGWEIVPSEINGGRNILDEGVDYSWDSVTGTFTLLIVGDVLISGQKFNIHFNDILNPAGNSYPTVTDFTIVLVTVSTVLDATYFGKKLIVEPAGVYCEITLPDITTVVQGRRLMVEIGGTGVRCVKFKKTGADIINFLRGSIYANTRETFSIYKYTRAGVHEWRICEADGNFKNVGQVVSDDLVQADVFNKQRLDGSSLLNTQYARLYNEVVLHLPIAQVVNYDDWDDTVANKRFYSLANSANPANANKFIIPDRRGDFERATVAEIAGTHQLSENKEHGHAIRSTSNGPGVEDGADVVRGHVPGTIPTRGTESTGTIDIKTIVVSGGTEARPDNYSINKYVLI